MIVLSEPTRLSGLALGVAVLIAAAWGFNFVVIKVGVDGMPPLLLASLRFAFSAFPALLFVQKPHVSLKLLALYGLLLGVGEFGFLFVAIKLGAPAGLSSIVLQSQAFFTAIIAAFVQKERIRWNQILGMIIASLGLALIVWSGPQTGQGSAGLTLPLAGMLLLAALMWAGANVSARAMPGANALGLMVWSSLFSPLPLLGLSLAFEGSNSWVQACTHLSLPTLGSLAYLVVISTLFGYGAWNHLIIKHGAGKIAPFSLLVPVFGVSSAALFLGERFSFADVIAAVLVLGGLCVHVFGGRLSPSKLGD